jgi:hypothetical protein
MSETGKLINGSAIAVGVAGIVSDSEELERERERGGDFISGKEAVAVMGKAESETGKLISEKVAAAE